MHPTITTDIRSQLAELAARAEQRDLRQRELDCTVPAHKIEIVEYTVPAHWANRLLHGECEGLTSDELNEIHSFLKRIKGDRKYSLDCAAITEGDAFAWHNDANNVGGPTCIATFYLSPRLGYLAQA